MNFVPEGQPTGIKTLIVKEKNPDKENPPDVAGTPEREFPGKAGVETGEEVRPYQDREVKYGKHCADVKEKDQQGLSRSLCFIEDFNNFLLLKLR